MKILVATPCYGSMLSQYYFMSFFKTLAAFTDSGWQIGTFTLGNESLIARGRNTAAGYFLKNPRWQKLFFIDADITWTPQDFGKIVTSSCYIIGGAVPLKKFPITLNFNPKKEDEHFFVGDNRSPESYRKMSEAHGGNNIQVKKLGTAFLCIDRFVLETLKPHVKAYRDTTTGPEPLDCWDFFGTGVDDDGDYLSEDWFFCRLAAEHGFQTHLHPDLIVKHTGNFTFEAGQ